MAGVFDVECRRARRQLLFNGKDCSLVLFVGRDLRSLGLSARRYRDVVEVNLNRVQRNAVRWVGKLEVDGFIAIEAASRKVNVDDERVMIGRGAAW